MRNPSASLVRTWKGERSWRSALWQPAGWLWAAGATLHRKAYDWGVLRRDRLEVPVVSVGNLIVGGAGKTPVTLALAENLLAAGRHVAVVSRGYGRLSTQSVVIVSDGQAVRANALEGGDEPVWLARRCPGLIVVVGARRADAAHIATELGADIILLDDGFSHHRLVRNDDVLVVDAEWGLGNRRTLPAGPLREPVRASRRASFVWLTKCSDENATPPPPLDAKPFIRSRYEPGQLVDIELRPVDEVSALEGARVVGLCGIARPEAFERTLRSAGASVRELLAFPDHHPYTQADLEHAASVARSERAEWIVTTEKDAVRLQGLVPTDVPLRALRMDVLVEGDTAALDTLIRRYAPGWSREKTEVS